MQHLAPNFWRCLNFQGEMHFPPPAKRSEVRGGYVV